MRTKPLLLVIGSLLTLAYAAQEVRWRKFAPPPGNVTIMMPLSPKNTQGEGDQKGGKALTHWYMAYGKKHIFWLTLTEYPEIWASEWRRMEQRQPDVMKLLLKRAESASLNHWGKDKTRLLQSKIISYKKLVGAECLLRVTDDGELFVRTRLLMSRRRGYFLVTMGQPGEENARDVTTFFNSLEVGPKG